jgi:DNA-directed RNA polymerase specialized sigma24 family protein
VYSKEVESLNSKLNIALKNAPLERRAQSVAAQIVAQRRRANPGMEKAEIKKIKGQALEEARVRTGAKKTRIEIDDNEWKAIQAGAISADKMTKILQNTDVDKLRERATPLTNTVMSPAKQTRAKGMLRSGATYAEIAEALGVSASTLRSSLVDDGAKQ